MDIHTKSKIRFTFPKVATKSRTSLLHKQVLVQNKIVSVFASLATRKN